MYETGWWWWWCTILLGPTMVADHQREVAGSVMSMFLMAGLTCGATFALFLNYLAGV